MTDYILIIIIQIIIVAIVVVVVVVVVVAAAVVVVIKVLCVPHNIKIFYHTIRFMIHTHFKIARS